MLDKLGERVDGLVRAVEPYRRLQEQGGILTYDRPLSPYDFNGAPHVSINRDILENMWRFGLASLDRGVLDYMVASHDEDGLVKERQVDLARHFRCSQPRIHRAVACLRGYHFIWMPRRAWYQLNPQYAYRFGSSRQRLLIARLGRELLSAHRIEIPGLGRKQ